MTKVLINHITFDYTKKQNVMTLTKEIKKLETLILKAKKDNNSLFVANFTKALNKLIEANEWLESAYK
jgi:hypothetical protein